MKILLLPLCLSFSLISNGNVTSAPLTGTLCTLKSAKAIDDGWYSAIVKTGYSKYRLNVKVQYDRVIAIDFGNGGSVHTGVNNEDYIYGGGYLSTYGDEATAVITISEGYSVKQFNITLE